MPLERMAPLGLIMLVLGCAPPKAGQPAKDSAATAALSPDTTTGTALERAAHSRGFISIRAFGKTVPILADVMSGSLVLSAVEVQFPESNARYQGLRFGIGGAFSCPAGGTYLDYDEIDPLVKGLRTIAAVDSMRVPFPKFEATYETRGGLVATRFTDDYGKVQLAIEVGCSSPSRSYFPIARVAEIEAAILGAKDQLDSARARFPKNPRQ